jgi:hypothetical protein
MFFNGNIMLMRFPCILPIASIGNLQVCLLSFFDLNFGKPLPSLKNDLYDVSKLIKACCKTFEWLSFSQEYFSSDLRLVRYLPN